jgi:hypothetical protein
MGSKDNKDDLEFRFMAKSNLLPTVKLGRYDITRLIIGGNPFRGYSHWRPDLDRQMAEWNTAEHIADTLCAAEAAGINTMQMRGDKYIFEAVEKYRARGGRMHWICQTASEWPDVIDNIRTTARHKPIAIYHHGTNTDKHFAAGTMEVVRERIELIKELGLLAGVASHLPEVHEWLVAKGWPIDFHMCCVYNLSRQPRESKIVSGQWTDEDHMFCEDDPPKMCRFVQQVDRPCLVFKVLAASRKCQSQETVRAALKAAYQNIKPSDAVIVGMWSKHLNQPALNADHVRGLTAG